MIIFDDSSEFSLTQKILELLPNSRVRLSKKDFPNFYINNNELEIFYEVIKKTFEQYFKISIFPFDNQDTENVTIFGSTLYREWRVPETIYNEFCSLLERNLKEYNEKKTKK